MATKTSRTETRISVIAVTDGVRRAVVTIPVRKDGEAYAAARVEAYSARALAAGADDIELLEHLAAVA